MTTLLIEELAEEELAELTIVDTTIVHPCCEICGCTIPVEEYDYWVTWEAVPEGDWPRFHMDCYDHQVGLERQGTPYRDVFAYS